MGMFTFLRLAPHVQTDTKNMSTFLRPLFQSRSALSVFVLLTTCHCDSLTYVQFQQIAKEHVHVCMACQISFYVKCRRFYGHLLVLSGTLASV